MLTITTIAGPVMGLMAGLLAGLLVGRNRGRWCGRCGRTMDCDSCRHTNVPARGNGP